MAIGMYIIFISGIGGITKCCRFPKESFNETTISELKFEVLKIMKIDIDNQRLMYNCQELYTERNDREMTFGDYGIANESTINLIIRLAGGGGPAFLPFRFADVSRDNFKVLELDNSAPDWRIIDQGVNFVRTCKNKSCKAKNDFVYARRGLYEESGGTCMLNYEITQLECPMCGHRLNKNDINGVGVYKARLNIKSKRKGRNEVTVDVEARDKFLYAGCMDDKNKVEYEYVILIVKRF